MVAHLNEKFGEIDDYKDFDKVREEIRLPAVYEYSQNYVLNGNENPVHSYPDIFPPTAIFAGEEEGAELFDYGYYINLKALRGLERTKPKDKNNKNRQRIENDKLIEEEINKHI